MILKPWWERWSGLLDFEIKELEKAGFNVSLDQLAKERDRVIVLHLKKAAEPEISKLIRRDELNLKVVYPGAYPYLKPIVFTKDDLPLIYHINPIHRNLCLLPGSTEYWSDEETAAKMITEQLYKTIKAGTTQEDGAVRELEYPQGEPETAYFSYLAGSGVLYDSDCQIDKTAGKGFFQLGIHPQSLLNMALLEVTDASGNILHRASKALFDLYGKKVFKGRWLRVEQLPIIPDPQIFLQELRKQEKHFFKPAMNCEIGPDVSFEYFGTLFPEDALQREKRDGWQFVIAEKRKINKTYTPVNAYFARPMRAGKGDIISRTPELTALHEKKIAIVGLGCVGAPASLEFAKAGIGEIRILDYDYVEAGTTVRWPFGLTAIGHNKTNFIEHYIKMNYPHTQVIPVQHALGSCFYPKDGSFDDYEAIQKLLEGADLVYDASAEPGIMNLISDLASEIKIPYLRVSSNWGAWGGIVARIMPEKEGCFSCFMLALSENDPPEHHIDLPYSDEKGFFQPTGCASPTFTGASFDINLISMTGVRYAISTLLNEKEAHYPAIEKDICIIKLRDQSGNAIIPSFSGYALRRHPKCRNH
jgi:ThiF family